MEEPDQREFADEDPRGFLARFPDGAVLDEVQRCPSLFSYLQGKLDQDGRPGMFILTGSQQFGLLAGITQTLAGRVALLPIDIKSGQTVTRNYLIGLQKWLALAGAFASKPLLIYAGDSRYALRNRDTTVEG